MNLMKPSSYTYHVILSSTSEGRAHVNKGGRNIKGARNITGVRCCCRRRRPWRRSWRRSAHAAVRWLRMWERRVRVLRGGTLLVLQHERLRDRVRVVRCRWLRAAACASAAVWDGTVCVPHEMIQLLRSLRVCSALSHAWSYESCVLRCVNSRELCHTA